MGKNKNKSAAAQAAEQQAPKVEEPKVEKPTAVKPAEEAKTIILPHSKVDKLSQDSKVQYMALLQERYVRNNEGVSAAMRNGMNMIIDAMAVDVAVTEVVVRGNPVAFIVQNDPERYLALQEMGLEMGVRLPDLKSLPAPTPQQLEQAGLSGQGGQAKLLTVVKTNITKAAQEKKTKEVEAQKKYSEFTPKDVKNEEDLKGVLTACFCDSNDNPARRMKNAISFYTEYLKLQAGDDKEKLKAIEETSRTDMLQKITEIVGECTFALNGFSKMLRDSANDTKSPVSAFCFVKRIFDRADPKEKYEDSFIADVVKTLITWSCTSKTKEFETLAARNRKLIEKYEKEDPKDEPKLRAEKTALAANEKQIENFNSIIEIVQNPSFEVVENLAADYDANPSTKEYKNAHRIVDSLLTTFYNKKQPAECEKESMLEVTTYRAGLITNLFVDPLNQSISYKEDDVPELKEVSKEQ